MNASLNTTAAEWMNRLSDRLGSLISGGSRWSPRHPVKVSLVMGILGAVAGWAIYGFWSGFGRQTPTSNDSVYWGLPPEAMIASSTISGVLVLAPLLLWNKNSWLLACCGIPMAMLSRYASETIYAVSIPYFTDDAQRYIYTGLEDSIVALAHAAWVGGIIRRHCFAVISLSMLTGACVGSTNLYLYDISSQATFQGLFDVLLFAAPWVSFYSTLSICLGISLWDTTPRPIFESAEPT